MRALFPAARANAAVSVLLVTLQLHVARSRAMIAESCALGWGEVCCPATPRAPDQTRARA
jgi:hypothetical protein